MSKDIINYFLKQLFLSIDKNDSSFSKTQEKQNTVLHNNLLSDLNSFEETDVNLAWNKLHLKIAEQHNQTNTQTVIKKNNWYRYVAIFIGFIMLGAGSYHWVNVSWANQTKNTITQQNELVSLTINNNVNYLKPQKDFVYTDTKGNIIVREENGLLIYRQTTENTITYNHKLQVPYGKKMTVLLSDGTKIYCDAGTSISYPHSFKKATVREVYLDGQAYFDVAKNPAKPFYVNTKNLSVRVLGTQFNVAALTNTKHTNVALVEGLIKVTVGKNTKKSLTKTLSPGQLLQYNKELQNVQVTRTNSYEHTAWLSGKLIFKDVSFKEILDTLERKFNVKITNTNKKLAMKRYRAKFDVESLEDILSAFSKSAAFSYRIKGNKITIK